MATMTNGYTDLSATECDIILRAREELASKYGWGGRVSNGYDCLTQGKLISGVPHMYSDKVVEVTLAQWDRYNEMVEGVNRLRVEGCGKLGMSDLAEILR